MEETIKMPLPGYGLAVIDKDEDDGEDKFDTPQVGKLLIISEEDKDTLFKDSKEIRVGDLLGKTIYWKKYADQDATFFDKNLGEDVVFIKLEAIVGYDK